MAPTSRDSSDLPLALTAGEPAGIGPDLCLATALGPRAQALVCLADWEQLTERAHQLRLTVRLQPYRRGEAVTQEAGELCVQHMPLAVACRPGQLDTRNAAQVLALIDRGVDGCVSGEFGGIVTAPVQKSVI